MGYRIQDEYVEAPLASKDATDEDRGVIGGRADRARAWVTACREARNGVIEWAERPAWRRIGR